MFSLDTHLQSELTLLKEQEQNQALIPKHTLLKETNSKLEAKFIELEEKFNLLQQTKNKLIQEHNKPKETWLTFNQFFLALSIFQRSLCYPAKK